MSKVRNIRVDDATWAVWQEDAKAWGMSVSGLIRFKMRGARSEPRETVTLSEVRQINAPQDGKTVEPTVFTKAEYDKKCGLMYEGDTGFGMAPVEKWKPPMPSAEKYVPKPEAKLLKRLK